MATMDEASAAASMSQEEFLANYNDYIEELKKLVEKVNRYDDYMPTKPSFYSGDGVNVFVSSIDANGIDTYLMSHNLGENIASAMFAYFDGGFRLTNEEEFYECQNDGHVAHYDSTTGYTEELMDTIIYGDPDPIIIYRQSIQTSPNNYNALVMHYPIKGFQDPDFAARHLHRKSPEFISFDKVLFGRNFSKPYALNDNDNLYYRMTPEMFGCIVQIPFMQPKDKEGLMKVVNSRGFRSNPSNDVIDLYCDDNNYVKTIKKVADMYRERC